MCARLGALASTMSHLSKVSLYKGARAKLHYCARTASARVSAELRREEAEIAN